MIERLAGAPADHEQVTHVPWVFVDDLEAPSPAPENRATIVRDIESHGFTSYVALDLEGRRWQDSRLQDSSAQSTCNRLWPICSRFATGPRHLGFRKRLHEAVARGREHR